MHIPISNQLCFSTLFPITDIFCSIDHHRHLQPPLLLLGHNDDHWRDDGRWLTKRCGSSNAALLLLHKLLFPCWYSTLNFYLSILLILLIQGTRVCSDLLFSQFAIQSLPSSRTHAQNFIHALSTKNPFWFYPSLKYPSLTSHTCLSPPWIGYHFYVLILLSTYLSLWASLPCRYFCRVFHCISGPCMFFFVYVWN